MNANLYNKMAHLQKFNYFEAELSEEIEICVKFATQMATISTKQKSHRSTVHLNLNQ